MQHISIKTSITSAVVFVTRNGPAMAARIVLPAIAGWAVLLLSLSLYLAELERYLRAPSDRVASLVLGVASAGLLVALFAHTVIVATISSLALGRPQRFWPYFDCSRPARRLYAAYMRYGVIWVAVMAVLSLLSVAVNRWLGHGAIDYLGDVLSLAAAAVLAVRIGFPMGAIAVAGDSGPIIRRAWALTSGNFWRLAAVVACFAIPAVVVELGCEWVIKAMGLAERYPYDGTFAQIVSAYRHVLPAILTGIGIAYLVGVTLLTTAAAFVCRQLTEGREASGGIDAASVGAGQPSAVHPR